jgi:hypothetical protein
MSKKAKRGLPLGAPDKRERKENNKWARLSSRHWPAASTSGTRSKGCQFVAAVSSWGMRVKYS